MRTASGLRLAAALAFGAGLMGCAGGRAAGTAPVDGRAYAGRVMAVILPGPESVMLRDAEALAGSLPGGPVDSPAVALARACGETFWARLSASLDYVVPARVPASVPPAPAGRMVTLKVPATYALPAHAYGAPDSAWLAGHGAAASLALVVGPLSASVEKEEIIAPKFGGSLQVRRLVLEGWYLIWDYAGGRALAYGRFRPVAEYRARPGPRDWMKVCEAAATAVGEASPFKGPRWYAR